MVPLRWSKKVSNTYDTSVFYERGLWEIFVGDIDLTKTSSMGSFYDINNPADRFSFAVKRKLADEQSTL